MKNFHPIWVGERDFCFLAKLLRTHKNCHWVVGRQDKQNMWSKGTRKNGGKLFLFKKEQWKDQHYLESNAFLNFFMRNIQS